MEKNVEDDKEAAIWGVGSGFCHPASSIKCFASVGGTVVSGAGGRDILLFGEDVIGEVTLPTQRRQKASLKIPHWGAPELSTAKRCSVLF